MTPMYKVQYFEAMGVAEPIRYLLSYGGVGFTNVFVKKEIEWPVVRKTLPLGQLPALQTEDKVLVQSVAISRWLAAKFQLMPEDEFLAAELDSVVETFYGLWNKMHLWYGEMDKNIKSSWHAELESDIIPTTFKSMEDWVVKRGGFFAGKEMMWADVYFAAVLESLEGMWGSRLLLKFPALQQLVTKVRAAPQIHAYIAKRPKYAY